MRIMTSSPEPGDTPSEPRRVTGRGEVAMINTVRAALTAYAAGDAFGVAYEFLDTRPTVDTQVLGDLPDWPHGGVSDDTLLTLLTIGAVSDDGPAASAAAFLSDLRRALPELRGLGPTTRAALGLPVPADQTAMIGSTNGAMMRTALLGLGFPTASGRQRRELVHAMASVTHPDPVATTCAVLASALFSALPDRDALLPNRDAVLPNRIRVRPDGATVLPDRVAGLPDRVAGLPDGDTDVPRDGSASLAALLQAEAAALPDVPGTVARMLADLGAPGVPGRWHAPDAGVSLSPVETLAAVVTVAAGSATCLEAYRQACELGGDTDTVSALAAALVATRDPEGCGLATVPWLDEVRWDEIPQLPQAVSRLARMRATGRIS
jgi:ADP-ribosylglycohydrolase